MSALTCEEVQVVLDGRNHPPKPFRVNVAHRSAAEPLVI
jgi:hypothetical protein